MHQGIRLDMDIYFDVSTPLGFDVRVTYQYWRLISTVKHPVMLNQERAVQEALQNPDQVRRSRTDHDVYLFYKLTDNNRWTCAVAKKINGNDFLITCYPNDCIKEGEKKWPR